MQSSQSGNPVAEKAFLLGTPEAENGQDEKEDANDSAVAGGPKNGQLKSVKGSPAPVSDQMNGQTDSVKDAAAAGERKNKQTDSDSAATTKNGKKRSADQVAGKEDEPSKKTKDSQMASSKTLFVPVDDAIIDEPFYFPGKSKISTCPVSMD